MPSEDDELVLVGHGPVATVYAGESDDTAFALKIYPGEVDRRSLRSVRAELATLAELRDRARILVADSVERRPGGTTALRMELCAQSLSELVEEAGRRPGDEAVALGEAPAETLAAAHDRGIVHGGVSPGNVLFEGSGDALLSDFGTTLRRHFSAESTPHGAVAPETLRDGVLDRRSDLYGLGATLYFALTGHAPHPRVPGEPDDRSVLRVLKDPAAPLDRPGVPPALADLVAQLLAKDPADRPGSLTPLQT
ncbi:serine/threonine-protein kinase [Saccharomonospora azurea]|uniref:serine/threonine-protein kinase n=1 Tax=Saccharomonospora azurea TaxID=40988 RepID=UPI00332074A7